MIPGLVERMAALMRVENEEQDKEEIIVFKYVLSLEIQLSEGEGWDPIKITK
jgi:hypothetical protein